ncbi:MAG: hypothetical protein HY795_14080 [Desulfovibrio sp.]|nr:hypothetical protein [Desulfovibrio sp.]
MSITQVNNALFTGISLTPYNPLKAEAVQGFAHELTRRSAQSATKDGAKRTVEDAGLETAITNAVDFVKDNFGDQAARTVMGIVTNRAGSGPLSEDEIGQGFVDSLEFIDRSFGIAAGDKAMAYFNGELNQAINGYFQNGKDETFLAADVEQATNDLNITVGTALSSLADTFQAGSTDEGASLMDQASEDLQDMLDEAASGSRALVDENGRLITEYSTGSGTSATEQTLTSGQDAQAQIASNPAVSPRSKRSLSRRRTGQTSGYEQSGLKPGLVLNSSV